MRVRHLTRAVGALVLAGATVLATAMPADAKANDTSLAEVLAADGSGFDTNAYDFDILDNAITAVLTAKPDSPVAVLADGKTRVTAFLPSDQAFRNLVADLTGTTYSGERAVFTAAATALGIDTIETVLLYHVVPGATITYTQALRSDGAVLTTALGAGVEVDIRYGAVLRLVDADPDDRNAFGYLPNVNVGNFQIGHGITQVLRPANL